MSELAAKIEAILFLSTRPVSFSKIAKIAGVKDSEVKKAVEELQENRNKEDSGIHVVVGESVIELATNPDFADVLKKMTREETEGELTRPQLETLTIVAYRGPITKPEIEHIRGVNCSIILRNLSMRGLIVEKEDPNRLQNKFTVSTEMLRHLGVGSVKELPDFKKFSENEKISKLLEAVFASDEVEGEV